MSLPIFDSNKKDVLFSYQTQAKMIGRRHGFEEVLTEKQADVDVMAEIVNMWGLDVKKKGPVAFFLSTLRNMICAVLDCCGTEQDFYRRLGLGTVRNLLVSVGF